MNQVLFIGGFPSGGTDLLKNILNAHPEILINGEMQFLYKLAKYGVPYDFQVKSLEDIIFLKRVIKKYDVFENIKFLDSIDSNHILNKPISLNQFFEIALGGSEYLICGNKTPQNTENISILSTYFPRAKFIIIVRDVRDVVVSWNKKWGKNRKLTAHKWTNRMQNISNYDRVQIIKFEDLIQNLKETTKRICTFLEIDWNEQMLKHQEYNDEIIDGKINYGSRVITNNMKKWNANLTERQVKRVEEISFQCLNKYSYKLDYAEKEKKITSYELLYGFTQDVLASLFIGNRMSSNNTFLNRISLLYKQLKVSDRI